jgi:hypothetical protein
VFHQPPQIIEPRLHLPGCDDLDQAIETRRHLEVRCVERNAPIVPRALPDTAAGWVRCKDGLSHFEAMDAYGLTGIACR